MKERVAWQKKMREILVKSNKQRQYQKKKKGALIFQILILVVTIFLISGAVHHGTTSQAACKYLFGSKSCKNLYKYESDQKHIISKRELSDEEYYSHIAIQEILNKPPIVSKHPKIAFMFLTPASLPFEKLWHLFFQGHDGKFSVYVHASRQEPDHVSRYFVGRDIRSKKVEWGKISMVEAEKRLLAHALSDPDNEHFVLLSDSCVPLRDFDYVYNYLMFTNLSYIDSFEDSGPDGLARYSERMLPEVEKKDFRKGSQWFSMKRQHALIVISDSLYFSKFKHYCRPNMDGRNCYADEHYLPTFFNMIDPTGISKWSITYVDWSERKWHPRTYRDRDITHRLLKNLTSINEVIHFTSDKKRVTRPKPCIWNGMKRPCFLFARKFYPETLGKLSLVFFNHTSP